MIIKEKKISGFAKSVFWTLLILPTLGSAPLHMTTVTGSDWSDIYHRAEIFDRGANSHLRREAPKTPLQSN